MDRARLILKASGGNWNDDHYALLELTKELAAKFLQWREVWRLTKAGISNLYELSIWSMPDELYSHGHLEKVWPGGEDAFSWALDDNDEADLPPDFEMPGEEEGPRGECYIVKVDGQENGGGVRFTWYAKHTSVTYSTSTIPWETIQKVYDGTYEPELYEDDDHRENLLADLAAGRVSP